MLTIKQFITASGLEVPHDRIKLVRHVNHSKRTLAEMVDAREFDFYQSEQSVDVLPFDQCDAIVSFLASGDGGCAFHGLYHVGACRPLGRKDVRAAPEFIRESIGDGAGRVIYELNEDERFRDLRGRVRVKWKAARSWVQRKDLEILEILPPRRVRFFPGYQNVILSWKELKEIIRNPDSHADWVTAMKFTAAIYRIVDLASGKIYIGSAYGREGLWQRWSDYANTGHGGNKKLLGLDYGNFQWSIVRTLSGVMSKREIILIEQLEMEKHGSKAIGLNWDAARSRTDQE
jgi:hypothetical protein